MYADVDGLLLLCRLCLFSLDALKRYELPLPLIHI